MFLPISDRQHVVESYFNPPSQFLSSLDIFELFRLIIIDVLRLKPAVLLLSVICFLFLFSFTAFLWVMWTFLKTSYLFIKCISLCSFFSACFWYLLSGPLQKNFADSRSRLKKMREKMFIVQSKIKSILCLYVLGIAQKLRKLPFSESTKTSLTSLTDKWNSSICLYFSLFQVFLTLF